MEHNTKRPPRLDALPEDNPETIAKHAICVVEKAIKDRFGLEVHGGIELEYGLFVPEELKRSRRLELLANEGRDDRRLFPQSSWVGYSYREAEAEYNNTALDDNGWHKHESIISHLAPHDKIPMGEGRFVVLARAVESLRRTIATPSSPSEVCDKDSWNKKRLHWINQTLTERITDARHAYTHGIHLNLSLTHEDGSLMPELRVLWTSSIYDDPILKIVQTDVWNEAAYLLTSTSDSYIRERSREGMSGNRNTYLHRNRMECKQPPSAANPYYVSLVGLLSLYFMLDKANYDKDSRQFRNVIVESGKATCVVRYSEHYPELMAEDKWSLSHLEQAFKQRFFSGAHLIRGLLDGMEAGLGTRFEKAIERTPPGTEKSKEAAGIVSYKDIVTRRAAQKAAGASRA